MVPAGPGQAPRPPRTLLLALRVAAAGACPDSVQAQGDAKPDFNGKWAFTVQGDLGSGTPTATFKQQDDPISGRYSSQVLGQRDFTGTFKAGKISFAFSGTFRGSSSR
jgi:hypothetical protein